MYQLNKEKTEELINVIIGQAKYFLNQADEFYPFGAIIDNTGLIKPVSIYWGEDFPNSIEVLNNLENSIRSGIKSGDYLCGAIGVDVYTNVNSANKEENKDALEVRYYQGENCYTNQYFYHKANGEYILKR